MATVKRITSLPFGTAVHLIAEGDAQTLAGFLESKHVTVQERDENGQTLLMIACQHGQFDIVRDILRRGAEVNADDNDSWTPLINAAKGGYEEVVSYLIASGAELEHRDMGGWTALMWACYKGHAEVAHALMEEGACANIYDPYHISCLIWASGRGHLEIVRDLLAHGAKVATGDKYGTTPLVWASRKGYTEIVRILLEAGANVDTAGMYSWTSLIVAAKGNHVDVVGHLLNYKPNVNAMDKDGCTALTIACKEGFTEIVNELLAVGAYVNVQDKNGDTHLILACRAGHYAIVDVLLKKYADTDIQGTGGKTALYWAVEKNHADIVRLLLGANPNLEIPTKEGDTALMKATRNRNVEIVQLLIDKKAKVSAADKKGDTALHVAMRSSVKGIVEVLLRNPKNSQLLYRPNRAGETPYNIDASHQRSILAQIFGARRLNTNEDSENMLGYDLYSSALADILSEPSLSMPISVGLYAKWGSGKSFLLNKLEEEMRNFAIQWLEATFEFSWLVVLLMLLLGSVFGTAVMFATRRWEAALSAGAGLFIIGLLILGVVWYGTQHYDWLGAYKASIYLAKQLASFKVLLQITFCSPPASRENIDALPVKFLFTGHTKVSSSGGDLSVTQIIISLCNTLEDEYGYFTTRLFRVFKPKQVSAPTWRWRHLCCVPNYLIALLIFSCILSSSVLLLLHEDTTYQVHRNVLRNALISLGCVVAVVFISNLHIWVRMAGALCISHQRRVQHSMSRLDDSERSHLEAVKSEVEAITNMVKCLDSFVGQQTRLVVVVDGLDSCEQEKVLRVLDAVHLLFSHPNAPFITVLAIDPHIIIKAIQSNIHRVFHNSSISGYDYLRNIVHLPFFLQNSGLRRVKAAQQAASQSAKRQTSAYWNEERECDRAANSVQASIRKASISSLSIPDAFRKGRGKGNHKLKASESMASSISNLHRTVTGAHDLTKVLLTDDYFSDVNPRSMRRLMNIVYVTGRLLKAFNIDFNWYHLASWINITEQWPYRTSLMILYYETHDVELEDSLPLRVIYERVKPFLPVCREAGPQFMIDHDHDERKFEVFLSFHSGSLLMSDLKVFLPFTINLDPFIRKSIQEDNQHIPNIFRSDVVPPTSHTAEPVISEGNIHGRWPFGQKKKVPPPQLFQNRPDLSLFQPESMQHYPPHTLGFGAPNYAPFPPYYGFHKTHKEAVPSGFDKISSLNVSGVEQLVESLSNIDKDRVKDYCSALLQHNINGRVLLTCNLEELKGLLGMTFGDWELFRVSILALRDKEMNATPLEEPVAQLKVPTTTAGVPSVSPTGGVVSGTIKSHRSESISEDRLMGSAAGDTILARTTIDDRRGDMRHRSRSASSALEKQVTMEESLIVGALETLNEEAYEDASEERILDSGDGPQVPHMQQHLQLNPLSPILSDPEELSPDDSDTHSPAVPEEMDVMYLKGAKPSQIMHSKTSTFDDGGWDYDPISPVPSSQMLASSCETSPIHQMSKHFETPEGSSPQTFSLTSSPTGKDAGSYRSLADTQSVLPYVEPRLPRLSFDAAKSGLMQSSNLLTFIASSLDSLPKVQSCLPEVTFSSTHFNTDHVLLPKTDTVTHDFTNDNFVSESSDELTEAKPRDKVRHKRKGSGSRNVAASNVNNNFCLNNNMESEDEAAPLVSPVYPKPITIAKPLFGSPTQGSIRKSKSEPSQRRPPFKRQVSIETVSTLLEDSGSPPMPRSATQPLKQFSKKETPMHPNSPVSQTSLDSLENSNETIL